MDSKIRREALRAAAKLAFGTLSSVALIGCGGKTDFSRDLSGGNEDRADLSGPPDAACAYPAAVVLSESFPAKANFTKAELDCCTAHVEARIESAPATAWAESDVGNCCNAIITAVDAGMMTYGDVTGSVRQTCCFSGNQELEQSRWNHNLCAPWGPPVPPALDWSIEGVA
jgi:hypothetical protein